MLIFIFDLLFNDNSMFTFSNIRDQIKVRDFKNLHPQEYNGALSKGVSSTSCTSVVANSIEVSHSDLGKILHFGY